MHKGALLWWRTNAPPKLPGGQRPEHESKGGPAAKLGAEQRRMRTLRARGGMGSANDYVVSACRRRASW
jgi:hypothetical protein